MALIYQSRKIITIDAFIADGQSNMESGTNVGTIPAQYLGVNRKALVAVNLNNNLNINNFVIQNLEFGVNQVWRIAALPAYCGPELAFAKDWTAATGGEVVIIKYALGGSAMVDDGTVYSNGYWQWNATNNPAPTADPTSGRNHYEILRDYYVIQTILNFRSIGVELNFRARITDQGETDMGTLYRANNWGTVYRDSYYKLQEEVAPYNSSILNMVPVVCRTGGPNYTNVLNRPYYSTVRQQQEDIITEMNGLLISKDSLTTGADGVHETRDQQCIKGSMIASTLLPILEP